MHYYLQQGFFILKHRYIYNILNSWRKPWLSIWGMHIGKGTILPKLYISWPNQVKIGDYCVLERDISFKFAGIWNSGPSIQIMNRVFIGTGCEFNITRGIIIGEDSNIASGCRFIDHDHGTALGQLIGNQEGSEEPITIGNDVWLGCNVVVLKGVTIGNGAIIGAGAVVTKPIPQNEVWAGVPARRIGQRH